MPPDLDSGPSISAFPRTKSLPDGDPDKGGSAGAPKTQGMKFSFDVPLPSKKVKVWGDASKWSLPSNPIVGDRGNRRHQQDQADLDWNKGGFQLQDKTASKVLSSGNIFSDLKLARQATSLVATSSTSTAIGKFDLKITFLSLDKKLQKDASLKLALRRKWRALWNRPNSSFQTRKSMD